jgi:hypothetical protein
MLTLKYPKHGAKKREKLGSSIERWFKKKKAGKYVKLFYSPPHRN